MLSIEAYLYRILECTLYCSLIAIPHTSMIHFLPLVPNKYQNQTRIATLSPCWLDPPLLSLAFSLSETQSSIYLFTSHDSEHIGNCVSLQHWWVINMTSIWFTWFFWQWGNDHTGEICVFIWGSMPQGISLSSKRYVLILPHLGLWERCT